jgi:hypothetical protein
MCFNARSLILFSSLCRRPNRIPSPILTINFGTIVLNMFGHIFTHIRRAAVPIRVVAELVGTTDVSVGAVATVKLANQDKEKQKAEIVAEVTAEHQAEIQSIKARLKSLENDNKEKRAARSDSRWRRGWW